MIWIYRILFLPLLLLLTPYYIWRMLRRGGYKRGFHHRFGLIPKLSKKVTRIWIQAVSVGEVRALEPLLKKLASSPVELVLTTTTSTAYQIVRKKYSTLVTQSGIFPLDFWLFSHSAWNRINPDLVILMESELWPEHLYQAHKRSVPVVLLNGRLSDHSFQKYHHFRPLIKKCLSSFDKILTSSPEDQQRFLALGAPPQKTHYVGNIKGDLGENFFLSQTEIYHLKKELGFPTQSLVLLGSSTWPGEEQLLLEVFEETLKENMDCRLLLVPRHEERRYELISLVQEYTYHLRSSGHPSSSVEIYVGDTTGELSRLMQVADVAFIGKSLPPHAGGQTPIEAAALGLPMVYGPHMSNFRSVCRELEEKKASWRVTEEEEAKEALLCLLKEPGKRMEMGEAARACYEAYRGATDRTLECLGLFS